MAWVCVRCNSTDLEIVVEWGESLEPVAQDGDTLEPANCDPPVCRITTGLCNSCGQQGHAHEVIVKGTATGVRPPGPRYPDASVKPESSRPPLAEPTRKL